MAESVLVEVFQRVLVAAGRLECYSAIGRILLAENFARLSYGRRAHTVRHFEAARRDLYAVVSGLIIYDHPNAVKINIKKRRTRKTLTRSGFQKEAL